PDTSKEYWLLDGKEAGWYHSDRNLTFVLIYNASHMAPVESALQTMDAFNRFIGATVLPAGDVVGKLVAASPTAAPPVSPSEEDIDLPEPAPTASPTAEPTEDTDDEHAPAPKQFNFIGGVVFLVGIIGVSGLGYAYVRSRLDGRPVTSANIWGAMASDSLSSGSSSWLTWLPSWSSIKNLAPFSSWRFAAVPSSRPSNLSPTAGGSEWQELSRAESAIFDAELEAFEADRSGMTARASEEDAPRIR
ncbi:hypothetical protein HK405_013636, partial [Cladochytrium tenue]